jgi:hypothetical protein
MKDEKRITERFKTGYNYKAKLILLSDFTVKDISMSGIGVITSILLKTKDTYRIELASPEKEKKQFSCEVVNCFYRGTQKEKDNLVPLYEVALKFIELNDSEKYFLEQIIRELANKTTTEKLGIKKQYLKTPPKCKVTFRLPKDVAPEAQKITVVGDFNNWNKEDILMKRFSSGDFAVILELETGKEYRYRYLIDGSYWENDWCADRYEPNQFGWHDSVVVV